MSSEQIQLVMTAVLAVVALGAAFVAVRAARRTRVQPAPTPESPDATSTEVALVEQSAPVERREPETAVARIVEGRVIIAPTSRQVVNATLGKPLVRVSVISHGLAHALRPESRDRILALMRREFQSRRRQRKRAARQAARLAHPAPPSQVDRPEIDRSQRRSVETSQAWLGELPAARPGERLSRESDS